MLIETKNLTRKFGGVTAAKGLNLTVSNGEILGLIGPNGSGKTTVLNLMSGFLRPTEGRIIFNGQDITNLPAHVIASKGMARTLQIKTTFSSLSVLENVVLASNLTKSAAIYRALASPLIPRIRYEEEATVSNAMATLRNMGLDGLANNKASTLPLAQERFLGMAMAIVGRPKLLLLDEPVGGMNREEMRRFMTFVVEYAQDTNMGVLLVEHTMAAVMNYCTRVVVIDRGEQIACGTPEAIKSDLKVQQAYLGEGA